MLHCGLEITVPALASAAFAAGGEVRLEGVAEEAAAQLLVPARYGSDSGAGGGARKMNRSDSRPARLEWFGTPSIVSVS